MDGETGTLVATGVVPVIGTTIATGVAVMTGIRLGMFMGVSSGWGEHAAIVRMISSKISEVFIGLLLYLSWS
jgi:hypothetical protein